MVLIGIFEMEETTEETSEEMSEEMTGDSVGEFSSHSSLFQGSGFAVGAAVFSGNSIFLNGAVLPKSIWEFSFMSV